ncbi:MAG: TetR/AcrR family transcriptional regulator [Proteobacteria bacterium]|nr:TetR/AcrR family transcriptional regulator [Pseudomonadota bacterium]MBU1058168.1 TetR/AcrR family transcriptional regulator [Pseudomonadota bacterium]
MKPKKQQTRRRSKQAHEAIIAATLELIEEKGYLGLSIEGIAARAGVGKQTIYRWWPSKAALTIEAYSQKVTSTLQSPDTGSLQLDLEELLGTIFTRIRIAPTSKVMTGLIAEAQTAPDVGEQFYTGFIKKRRELLFALIQKGINRGEVPPDTDMEIAADTLFGPMWYRLLLGHAPLDQKFAKKLVEQLMVGLATRGEETL